MGSGVLIAFVDAQFFKDECRCLIDRRDQGASRRVRLLTFVNGSGGKTVLGRFGCVGLTCDIEKPPKQKARLLPHWKRGHCNT